MKNDNVMVIFFILNDLLIVIKLSENVNPLNLSLFNFFNKFNLKVNSFTQELIKAKK